MKSILMSSALGGSIVMKNSTAIVLGVGIGITISAIGIGCYCYYRHKKTIEEKEAQLERKTAELLSKKECVEKLNSSEIVDWFKNNIDSDAETSCVVSRPIERVLTGLGCKIDKNIYGDNSLIQMIYDTENKQAVKIRLSEYKDIDTNLEAQIDESDGFMVVTL